MTDVKEVKEVLVAVIEVAKALAKASKDGLDLNDVAALIGNDDVKAALSAAAIGISKVPEEIKDLGFDEGLDLAMTLVKEIPALIESFKK